MGYIKANPYNAAEGTTVTITVTPLIKSSTRTLNYYELTSKLVFHATPPLGVVNDVNAACSADNETAVVDSADYLNNTYYPLDSICATTNDNNATPITLTEVNDTTYTFTMPASSVKVVASFGSMTTESEGAKTPMTDVNDLDDFQDNGGTIIVGPTTVVFHALSLENVFDFTNDKTIQISNSGNNTTYGSLLVLNAFNLGNTFSGTKQLSLAETKLYIPDTMTEAEANQKMFEVTGDGNGNFTVRCLLSSPTVVTTDYFTPKAEIAEDPDYQMRYGLIDHKITSKQVT